MMVSTAGECSASASVSAKPRMAEGRVGRIDGDDLGLRVGNHECAVDALEDRGGQTPAALGREPRTQIDEGDQTAAWLSRIAQRIGRILDRQRSAVGAPEQRLVVVHGRAPLADPADRTLGRRQRAAIGAAVMQTCMDVLPDQRLCVRVAEQLERAAVDVGTAPLRVLADHGCMGGVQKAREEAALGVGLQ